MVVSACSKIPPWDPPAVAAWIEVPHDPVPQTGPVVEVVCGSKWRVEAGTKEKTFVAVFDGNSVQGTAPILNKARLDPTAEFAHIVKEVRHPTSVEIIEKEGTKLTVYHCFDAKEQATLTLYVNYFTKRQVRLVTKVKDKEVSVDYQFLDYDVKAHESELFDTANLKPYFSEYLSAKRPADEAPH